MQIKFAKNYIVLSIVTIFFVSGCSFGGSDSERPKVKYEGKSKRLDRLEVPPNLTPVNTNDSMPLPDVSIDDNTIDLSTNNVLKDPENVEIQRDGQLRWLVVQEPIKEVWPKVVNFWEEDGVPLVTANPNTGVIETDWLVNYADFTSKFERLFQGLLNSITQSGNRDKYRMRLDNGLEPGTTEIYITHLGVEEVAEEEKSRNDIPEYVWQGRNSDPNLEAEVLRLLMVELGVDKDRADALAYEKGDPSGQDRAKLVTDTAEPILLVRYDENRAWRRVGAALDRLDVVMLGYNREQRAYVIESEQIIESDKGFFSRLWNREPKEESIKIASQVRLIPQNDELTALAIATEDGVHDSSDHALSLLDQLYELLK